MVSDVGFERVIGFCRIIWSQRVLTPAQRCSAELEAHDSVLVSPLGLLMAFRGISLDQVILAVL